MHKIIANSLPKSGTHLLVRVLELCGIKQSDSIHLSASLVRKSSRNPIKNLLIGSRVSCGGLSVDLEIEENRVSKAWLDRQLNKVRPGEFVEAHLPYSEELASFLLHEMKFKMIYIYRDPRAVALSYINHVYKVKNYPLRGMFENKSLSEKLQIVLKGIDLGVYKLLPLNQRLEKSYGWANSNNVCTVRFEDLIGPKGGGGRSKQMDSIIHIVTYLGLENVNVNDIVDQVYDSQAETFHKGTIDRWQKEFSQSDIELMNDMLRDWLNKLGYA